SEADPLQAIIIESKLDPKAGARTTAVIKKGTIAIKDEVVTQTTEGKVRSLITDSGQFVQKASIGEAVEILGFVKVPSVGEIVHKNYNIIYEMLDEIQQVIEGKQLALMEQIFGVAKLQATFPFEKTIVLGVSVLDGRVARGDKIRVIRGEDTIIGESQIVSLR